MKRIIISFLLTGTFFSLMAQDTDSTSANSNMKMTNDSTPAMNPNSNMNNMNNPVRTDSSSDMNNNSSSNTMSTDSSSNMNNLNSNMNNPSSNMNNNMKTDSSSNMTTAPASNMDNNSSSNMNNSVGTGMMANSLNVQGQPGYASLPVLENSIPDAVVAKVKEKYGDTVYDITGIKRTTDQKVYVIRMGTNGMYKTEMMNEDGSAVQ